MNRSPDSSEGGAAEVAEAADAAEADAHLNEIRTGSEQVYDGAFLHVYRDTVRLPGGGSATREFIRHPGAVMIVPIEADGRLVLERQFRYPLDRVLLEFPAGKIDPGESTLECARRELLEETGLRAREWALAGRMHNTPAYSDEFIEMWFARGLTQGDQQLDPGEYIEVVRLEEAELHARAARAEVTDAKTLVALLKLEQWRSGAWAPAWQTAD
ncbi:MAG TPA: NUDIX hydrolase [Burkholderiaceae bacterium]|nr:NUDIX hydrolase [Burkholderiaceae bacterium]